MALDRMEIAELVLISGAVGATWFVSDQLSWKPMYGSFVLYSAALMLGQGLVRDIARIVVRKIQGLPKKEGPKQMCLCAESSLGVLVILVGAITLLAGVTQAITVSQTVLTVSVAIVLVLGFLIKDYVISVRKEKDHDNVIVGFG